MQLVLIARMKQWLQASSVRAWRGRVWATSGTARAVGTVTAATDRAGDVIVRKKGTWDDGPVQ